MAALLSGELATHFLNLLTVLFFAAVMFFLSPDLTLLGIAVAALNIGILKMIARKREDANQKLLQDRGKLMGTVMSGLMAMETIKASGGESDLFTRWAGHQARVMDGEQELAVTTEVLNVVPMLLSSLATALIIGMGCLKVMNGAMTMGTLVAFQGLMNSFMAPVNRLVGLGTKLQEMKGNMDRLDDVLGYPVDPMFSQERQAGKPAPHDPLGLSGHLELRKVTFGYSRLEKPLIEDFNLVLALGKRVALIGASGSGKSTVARLVCDLYPPWSGEILFDGTPRHQVSRWAMIGSFAYVDQDIFLFEGTVRDNLTLWDRTVPEADGNIRRRGCTCLIVAHRLSTIRDCDEIIVLERGVVVQRGTHEGMKDTDGPYARLIRKE